MISSEDRKTLVGLLEKLDAIQKHVEEMEKELAVKSKALEGMYKHVLKILGKTNGTK